MIEGVEACDDIAISTTTFVSIEPFVEESSNMHAVIDVCSNESAYVIDCEVSNVGATLGSLHGQSYV